MLLVALPVSLKREVVSSRRYACCLSSTQPFSAGRKRRQNELAEFKIVPPGLLVLTGVTVKTQKQLERNGDAQTAFRISEVR